MDDLISFTLLDSLEKLDFFPNFLVRIFPHAEEVKNLKENMTKEQNNKDPEHDTSTKVSVVGISVLIVKSFFFGVKTAFASP